MTSAEGAPATSPRRLSAEAPRVGLRSASLALAAAGVVLLVGYLFFLTVVPQTAVRLEKTSAELDHRLALWRFMRSFGDPGLHGKLLLAALVGAAVLVFAAHLVAVRVARVFRSSRLTLAVVCAVAVVFTSVAALTLPNLDSDVYTYIATGRVAAVHHRDPYAHGTIQFPNDPFFRYELRQYTFYPDIKLAAWMPINIGLAEIAGNDPPTALLVYRCAFALFSLASLALVLLIVRRLRPERLVEAAVAWGWSPLVVLFAQSKVDVVMVFFLLAGIYALTRARRYLGLLGVTLATFVKLLTAPFLAALWLTNVRQRRWRALALSTVLLVGTIAVLYAPYSRPGHVLAHHLGLAATAGAGGVDSRSAARGLLLLIGVAALVVVALRRERTLAEQLRLWAYLGLGIGLFVAATQYPWYLLTLVAIVAVVGDLRFVAATSALGLFSFLLYERRSNSTHDHPLPKLSSGVTAAILIATLVVAVIVLVRMRRRGGAEPTPARAYLGGPERIPEHAQASRD